MANGDTDRRREAAEAQRQTAERARKVAAEARDAAAAARMRAEALQKRNDEQAQTLKEVQDLLATLRGGQRPRA